MEFITSKDKSGNQMETCYNLQKFIIVLLEFDKLQELLNLQNIFKPVKDTTLQIIPQRTTHCLLFEQEAQWTLTLFSLL